MRTLNEVLERKAYLEWFRHDLVYHFKTTPLSKYWHAMATVYFRTLDNEIDMLRWLLGEIENTWEDLGSWDSLLDMVQAEPQTRYPHLPLKADYHTYWGQRPRPMCRYFFGPDSPKDDQSFDFLKVQDPSTWNRSEFLAHHRYPRPGMTTRFYENQGRYSKSPEWMAYELGEGPEPRWLNGAWTIDALP